MMQCRTWNSYHIYYFDNHDFLLNDCIFRIMIKMRANKCIQEFFFLRYWEHGPHIRLRFSANLDIAHSEIKNTITNFLKEHPSRRVIAPNFYADSAAILSEFEHKDPTEAHVLLDDNSVYEHVYEPEYRKYGGEKGIIIAESFFINSTHIIMHLMNNGIIEKNKKLMHAFAMMCLAISAFKLNPEEILLWFKYNYEYWQKYANFSQSENYIKKWNEIAQQLLPDFKKIFLGAIRNQKFENSHMNDWYHILIEISLQINQFDHALCFEHSAPHQMKGLNKKMYLLSQYMHTHHNRYGLIPAEEAFLAFIGMQAIQSLSYEGYVDL